MNTVDIVLDYIEIGKKNLSFVCQKCQKEIAMSPEYYMSKFPDLFNFNKKDLEIFCIAINVRWNVLWIDWFMGKIRRKILQENKKKRENLIETINMYK